MTSPIPAASTPSAAARNRIFLGVAASVLLVDIVTKRWAERSLELHRPVEALGDTLRWTLVYNTGAAMNLSVGGYSRVVFSVIAIGMVVYLLQLLREAPSHARAMPAALGLVCAGAIGNLIDRLRHTRGVVDFIDVGTTDWRFWTFNVADIGVTCGAALLALLLWRDERQARSVSDSTSLPTEQTPP